MHMLFYECITMDLEFDMYGFRYVCVRDLCMYLFVYAGLQAPLNVSDGDTTSLEYIVRV